MSSSAIDTIVFGHRLRHLRRQRGLTLDELGALVGKPGPYLSQLENGHTEPKLSLLGELAQAVGVSLAELIDPTAPTRRAELEIAVGRAQEDPAYGALGLSHYKPSAKTKDEALEHMVALYEAWRGAEIAASGGDPMRAANVKLRHEMTERDNYFGDIEAAAGEVLRAVGYPGQGPLSERHILDAIDHFGFSVQRVQDLPPSSRSITDLHERVIYIPQRDALTTRAMRSVVLSTLGHFALGHEDPTSIDEYLRHRIESNYFAGAVLAPEAPVVQFLRAAKKEKDISAEDIKDLFYIGYEMAAHRVTNLITRHLDIPVHFIRTDNEGIIWKAYENSGVPFPSHPDGTLEGQRVPITWGPRQAFMADDTFTLHSQYTDTLSGAYWCVTHVETTSKPYSAITLGTTEDQAQYFRGHDTERRFVAPARDPQAAQREERLRSLAGRVWPSGRDRRFVVAQTVGLSGQRTFPGVDMDDVADFMERHDV
jgi:transcriptional regulator with XRE-family HTH domain